MLTCQDSSWRPFTYIPFFLKQTGGHVLQGHWIYHSGVRPGKMYISQTPTPNSYPMKCDLQVVSWCHRRCWPGHHLDWADVEWRAVEVTVFPSLSTVPKMVLSPVWVKSGCKSLHRSFSFFIKLSLSCQQRSGLIPTVKQIVWRFLEKDVLASMHQ